ncbi:MAG: hypothetical protein AB3N14_05510 [Flavobacteriaceae bacterium]
MRKLSLSLLFIGMTSLGFAQYSLPEFSNPFESSIRTVNADVDYLDKVQGGSTPNYVKLVEQKVSNWDPTLSSEFNKDKEELFNTTFKTKRGYVAAYYDNEGKIVFAEERFKNVALPYHLSRTIAMEYPGWSFEQTKYVLQYQEGKTTRRLFRVVIKKGDKTKRLKIHVPANK